MVEIFFCYIPLKYRGIYQGRNQLQAVAAVGDRYVTEHTEVHATTGNFY